MFPNLKPSTARVTLRMPAWLLAELKREANRRDVPYQSLAEGHPGETGFASSPRPERARSERPRYRRGRWRRPSLITSLTSPSALTSRTGSPSTTTRWGGATVGKPISSPGPSDSAASEVRLTI